MNRNDDKNIICECTLVNPCMSMCSCADEVLSGGCLKCDRYGKKNIDKPISTDEIK